VREAAAAVMGMLAPEFSADSLKYDSINYTPVGCLSSPRAFLYNANGRTPVKKISRILHRIVTNVAFAFSQGFITVLLLKLLQANPALRDQRSGEAWPSKYSREVLNA